jgi:ribosomal protein L12E/L44/L45/RPP1/RPP2
MRKLLTKKKKEQSEQEETMQEATHLVKEALTRYPEQQELMGEKMLSMMDDIRDSNVHPVVALYAIKGMEFVVADALKHLLTHSKEDEATEEDITKVYSAMMVAIDEVSVAAYSAIQRGDVPDDIKKQAEELACKHDCGKCKDKKETERTLSYIQ